MKCSKVGFVFSAVLWLFKSFCSALWLCNIVVVNDVANCGRLGDFLGYREHIHIWFPRTTYTAWLVYIIEFADPCHALKNSVVVKGLKEVLEMH